MTVIFSPLTTEVALAVTLMVCKSTVIVIEPSLKPSFFAKILVEPTALDSTKPEALTEAISGFSASQLTPSTEAVNWTDSPKMSLFLPSAAVILIDC